MPLLRRDDPARNHRPDGVTGVHEDRRPAPPRVGVPRNGIARGKPYTYRGSGRDELTAWMDSDGPPVAAWWALARAAEGDVVAAADIGPGPEWYAERAQEATA